MWKKQLTSATPLLSKTLLHRKGRAPLPSTTASSSYLSFKRSPLSKIFSPLSSSRRIETRENRFFSSRVFQNPKLQFGFSGQKSNLFYSGTTSTEKLQCWNCNSVHSNTTPFLVCQTCRSVQPVNDSIDYFQIFGLEKKYEIGGENLGGKYKDWQKKLHPDLVHTKSQNEREYAAEQSARVIDAYRTLTNQLSRAIYILKLEGVEVDEEERITDLELLAEIMEIRESVEEAADPKALKQIQARMHEKLEYWSKSFANALQSRDFEEALASIRRMRYYRRANEEIIKKL